MKLQHNETPTTQISTPQIIVHGRWKPYPAYKDSGVKWLGDVPEHWSITKIKYSTYIKGRVGWQNLRSDEFVNEGPYCITGTDFERGRINWDSCYHVTLDRYKMDPFIQLKLDDLLITKDGSIGKVALIDNLPDLACLNSGVFVTRPLNNRYITKYLFWVLSSKVFYGFIDYMSAGSTIQHLYQYIFNTFQFPLPLIDEQQAIARFLDHEIAKINSLIAKKQRLIELLQEKRTALISQAVTKGLNPNVPMKDSGVEWYGDIPHNWHIIRIKALAGNNSSVVQTGPFGAQLHAADYVDEGIPLILIKNVRDLYIDDAEIPKVSQEDANRLSIYRLQVGDVVFSRVGSIGRIALITEREKGWLISGQMLRLRINNPLLDNHFLVYTLA